MSSQEQNQIDFHQLNPLKITSLLLTDSTKCTKTWNATNATTIQSNQLGSSAFVNSTAKKIVTTAMKIE